MAWRSAGISGCIFLLTCFAERFRGFAARSRMRAGEGRSQVIGRIGLCAGKFFVKRPSNLSRCWCSFSAWSLSRCRFNRGRISGQSGTSSIHPCLIKPTPHEIPTPQERGNGLRQPVVAAVFLSLLAAQLVVGQQTSFPATDRVNRFLSHHNVSAFTEDDLFVFSPTREFREN